MCFWIQHHFLDKSTVFSSYCLPFPIRLNLGCRCPISSRSTRRVRLDDSSGPATAGYKRQSWESGVHICFCFFSDYISTNPSKTSFRALTFTPSFILEKWFTNLNNVTLGAVLILVATGKFFWANLVLTRVTKLVELSREPADPLKLSMST